MTRLLQFAVVAALYMGTAVAEGESILTAEIGRQNNHSLLWGPYKSNLYFGVRPRAPEGLWTGLMWSKIDNYTDAQEGLRYTCEQGEHMHGYGWDEYDARHGGYQTIRDGGNSIDITTSFVKIPGGAHGGSWAARIKGVPRKGSPKDMKTMLYYYIGQEGPGDLAVETEYDHLGFSGDVTFRGKSKTLGSYTLVVTKGNSDHPSSDNVQFKSRNAEYTVVHSLNSDEQEAWQAKTIVFDLLREAVAQVTSKLHEKRPVPPPWQVYRIANNPGSGNVHVVQKTFLGEFEFDVIFSSASAGEPVTSSDVTRDIKQTSELFAQRFSKVFSFQPPFNDEKYFSFGKSMFSNLIGGIGYFHGNQLIDRSYDDAYEENDDRFWEAAAQAKSRIKPTSEGPYELFTAVPSRPYFPRGFLWDEGFHLMLVANWDMGLALDVVKSWFNTMDDDGWIPREQMLGPEARTKVPAEFQVQYPQIANPPTLFLVMEDFMRQLRKTNGSANAEKETLSKEDSLHDVHFQNIELGEAFLRNIYPLLQRQYQWFRRTQRGEVKAYDREAFSSREAYRWRSCTKTHCLASGIDDYPRPKPPSPAELHVDLLSWVGLMTKSLINIADALGIAEDIADMEKSLEAIQHNLNDLHWSEDEGCFCDATVDDYEEHKLVCHKGYVSIMPFLVGLMKPDDPKLGKILELLGDENHLFSPHGIRSLSKQDEFYGTAENYWRSPVWMPMNYLAVQQLYHFAKRSGPYSEKARDLYVRLRKNLVSTVYESWKETGFAWEQYNPETGAGQRTQHFTGWTSLVVNLMAMEDLEVGKSHDEL